MSRSYLDIECKNEGKEYVTKRNYRINSVIIINEFNTKHSGKGPKGLYSNFSQSQLGTKKKTKEGSPLLKTNEKIQNKK